MNQVPVKWIRKTDGFDDNQTVRDWLKAEKGPKDYIPVIPLSALREVVEGVKQNRCEKIAWDCGYLCALEDLLAGLGEVGE